MKSVKSQGILVGNWLSFRQAQALLSAPDIATALSLRFFWGCGHLRSEMAAVTFGQGNHSCSCAAEVCIWEIAPLLAFLDATEIATENVPCRGRWLPSKSHIFQSKSVLRSIESFTLYHSYSVSKPICLVGRRILSLTRSPAFANIS